MASASREKNTPEIKLHVLEHNHRYATREDDVIPQPGSSHSAVPGKGAWKKFTVRAMLRAAFDNPAATAAETAKKFSRSSSRHISDAMYVVASILLSVQKLCHAEIFAPVERHAWLIQDFSSDEASFRLVAWGGDSAKSRSVYSTFASVATKSG